MSGLLCLRSSFPSSATGCRNASAYTLLTRIFTCTCSVLIVEDSLIAISSGVKNDFLGKDRISVSHNTMKSSSSESASRRTLCCLLPCPLVYPAGLHIHQNGKSLFQNLSSLFPRIFLAADTNNPSRFFPQLLTRILFEAWYWPNFWPYS